MIVAPQPVAAEAGLAVLAEGGSAVDAAVACAFVQGVVDPQMCGIGGCGVAAVRPPGAPTQVLEFYARAGSLVRPDQWRDLFIRESADRYGYVLEGAVNDAGYQSVGVPGTVAGLAEAHRRWGRLPWGRLLEPAIEAAADGFIVTGNLHLAWHSAEGPDVVPMPERLCWTEESKRIYTDGGRLHAAGDVLRCPDLAASLERLARAGAGDFYRGEIAGRIAADFAANGGQITAQDLAGYSVRVSGPVRGSYRGLAVESAGPPAGGLTLIQMLNYLEGFDFAGVEWPSPEAARRRCEAMEFAFADRDEFVVDPAFAPVPYDRLLAKEYAAAAREAHDSGTTHVCAVDSEGLAVSLTHTLGASSGVITPGLGFTYNNYLNCFDPRPGRPNSLAPGKTRVTMMVPTLVFDGASLRYVLGAPGGTKIVTGVLQTILGLVDHGLSPGDAVAAVRLDLNGGVVQAEQRMPVAVLDALAAGGYQVNRRPFSYDPYFSRVQLIEFGQDGRLHGASDPRKDGGIPLSLD